MFSIGVLGFIVWAHHMVRVNVTVRNKNLFVNGLLDKHTALIIEIFAVKQT
jgi:hypothetical protein